VRHRSGCTADPLRRPKHLTFADYPTSARQVREVLFLIRETSMRSRLWVMNLPTTSQSTPVIVRIPYHPFEPEMLNYKYRQDERVFASASYPIKMTTPIPQPRGIPFLGNINALDKELPLRSHIQLQKTYGEIFQLEFFGMNTLTRASFTIVLISTRFFREKSSFLDLQQTG
jgi:hypothetical protein